MSSLQKDLLGQIVRAIGERNIGEVFDGEHGRPTHQAWNKWQHGASPTLTSLEAVAEQLHRRLVVLMSDGSATAEASTGGAEVSPQVQRLLEEMDALEPLQRERLIGRIEGMLSEIRSLPSEPAAPEGRRGRGKH